MSKRAEEAALKAYPDSHPDFIEINIPRFVKVSRRHAYIEGYEQAEKDTIERIIQYLGERDLEHTILGFDIDGYAYIDFECLEKLIHKAMEKSNE